MFVENINEIDINTSLIDAMKKFSRCHEFETNGYKKTFFMSQIKTNWGSAVEHLCHDSKIKGSSPAMANQEEM